MNKLTSHTLKSLWYLNSALVTLYAEFKPTDQFSQERWRFIETAKQFKPVVHKRTNMSSQHNTLKSIHTVWSLIFHVKKQNKKTNNTEWQPLLSAKRRKKKGSLILANFVKLVAKISLIANILSLRLGLKNYFCDFTTAVFNSVWQRPHSVRHNRKVFLTSNFIHRDASIILLD